jgi:TPR repeat protein
MRQLLLTFIMGALLVLPALQVLADEPSPAQPAPMSASGIATGGAQASAVARADTRVSPSMPTIAAPPADVQSRADAGDPLAQVAVARFFMSAEPLPDYARAADWLNKASGQGNAEASYILASLRFAGQGSASDGKEALRLLEDSASKDFPPAISALGGFYLNGTLVEQDENKAASLFQKAANLGEPMAQAALAGLYLQGRGVIADREQAVFWLSVVGSGPGPNSDTMRIAAGSLGGKLSPEGLARVTTRLADWRKTHSNRTEVF